MTVDKYVLKGILRGICQICHKGKFSSKMTPTFWIRKLIVVKNKKGLNWSTDIQKCELQLIGVRRCGGSLEQQQECFASRRKVASGKVSPHWIVRLWECFTSTKRLWEFECFLSRLVCFYEKKGHACQTFTSMDCERCPIVALQLHFFHRKPAFEAESSWLGSFGLNTCGQLNGICFSPWPA